MALRSCRLLQRLLRKPIRSNVGRRARIWPISVTRSLGVRSLHTSAAAMVSASLLGQVSWLTQSAPAFGISGNNVEVIHEPHDFYHTLKEEASKAKHRIVLSSLYIGTGALEKDLIDVIHNSLQQNAELEIQVLLDYTRGSRGEQNSRTLLLPLLRDYPDRVTISLYHTPDLRGIWKAVMPERYNESIGVQHMKVYMFDNNLIISGANLSDSYFTNRQDRYTLLRSCPYLCDFFQELVSTIAGVSFQLAPDDTVSLLPDLDCHPFNDSDNGKRYRHEVKQRVESVLEPKWYEDFAFFPENVAKPCQAPPPPSSQANTPAAQNTPPNLRYDIKKISERRKRRPVWTSSDGCDTWVFPIVQMGPFGVRQDETLTTDLFCQLPEGSVINLASGYFNLTDHYMDTIVQRSQAQYSILTASPKANGFYGGSGISGYVPSAYTYIAKNFLSQVTSTGQQERIHLLEYSRPGWTFHAKGLWCYLPGQHWPFLTFVGSPNFGFRSVYRDLEAQIVIVTENEHLQKQLFEEQQALFQRSEEINDETFAKPDRAVPLWARLVTKYFIRHFF